VDAEVIRLGAGHEVDVVVVGTGVGGVVAALAAKAQGLDPLLVEKSEFIGGTSSWSGGALWAPDSPVMRRCGVDDSVEDGVRYLEAVVGDVGPSTTSARKRAFVESARRVIEFLETQGVTFVYSDGTSDYYPEAPGGLARGRTHHAEIFDTRRLGEWEPWFRPQKGGISQQIVMRSLAEAPPMTIATRTVAAGRVATRVVGRTLAARVTGRHLVGMGQALMAQVLHAARNAGVLIWRRSPVTGLLVEGGRVVGVAVERETGRVEVRARCGVLLCAGGFARNESLRKEGGREPVTPAWSAVIEEDTGDLIVAARAQGAATALMDEAIWTPMSVPPDGVPVPHLWERSLPGSILVDSSGARFCNEAQSYMAIGQRMFERHRTVPAIPAWLVLDARHRRRYPLGAAPPRMNPPSWLRSGYLKRASTLEGLAGACGIDSDGLRRTVERFNAMAVAGVDTDFHRGDSLHDRVFSDPTAGANPCLGPLDHPPFYAVAMYPGDVSTCGGLVTDEHARVLRENGTPIDGLYAAGCTAAAVTGRVYPAAGCSIASAATFGYLAVRRMTGAALARR